MRSLNVIKQVVKENPLMMMCIKTELKRDFKITDLLYYKKRTYFILRYLYRSNRYITGLHARTLLKNIAILLSFGMCSRDTLSMFVKVYPTGLEDLMVFITDNQITFIPQILSK